MATITGGTRSSHDLCRGRVEDDAHQGTLVDREAVDCPKRKEMPSAMSTVDGRLATGAFLTIYHANHYEIMSGRHRRVRRNRN